MCVYVCVCVCVCGVYVLTCVCVLCVQIKHLPAGDIGVKRVRGDDVLCLVLSFPSWNVYSAICRESVDRKCEIVLLKSR